MAQGQHGAVCTGSCCPWAAGSVEESWGKAEGEETRGGHTALGKDERGGDVREVQRGEEQRERGQQKHHWGRSNISFLAAVLQNVRGAKGEEIKRNHFNKR